MISLALVAAMVKSDPGCWTMILPTITEPFFKTTVVFCSALLEYKESKANNNKNIFFMTNIVAFY